MKNIKEATVILVCTDCENTRILYHGIKDEIPVARIITELPVGKRIFIRRRLKKLGIWTTAGQLFFQAAVVPLIRKLSGKKVQGILTEKLLNNAPMPANKITGLSSVNSEEFVRTVEAIQPDLILVNGTRIISSQILTRISCPIINVHVGITPLYRGVHGAYWALANKDKDHCGVTVHAVDKGIDTGGILAQDIIEPGSKDNFITYPYLQFEKAIQLVKKVVPAVINNSFSFQQPPVGLSKLWYHPTIWQYLYNRFKGVK